MNRLLTITLIALTLPGCSIYNAAKSAGQLMDYNTLSNDTIFNTASGRQFIVAPHRNTDKEKVLVCYQEEGIFASSDEQPLRDAANEWLIVNQKEQIAGESKDRSGTWDAKVCYEFDIVAMKKEQLQPIGAYLDETTGEVVVVGESDAK